MYATVDVERAWAARARFDFAMEALAHAHPSGWEGSAAQAAQADLSDILSVAWQLRGDLNRLAELVEEADLLRIAALGQVG